VSDRAAAPLRTGASLAALLAAFALVLFYQLGVPPAANPAESRVHAAVQSIADGGDWLVPTVAGTPRIEKPPGYAWLGAAAAELAGGVSWSTVRLPSALAALGLAALLFAWGRSLRGPDLGLLAALSFAAMCMTVDLGRRGVAEMSLALFCTLALFGFDGAHYGGRRWGLPVFSAALALAILAKATAALLVVGLPIAVSLALERSLSKSLRGETLAWLGLALVAGFAWYALVLAAVPDAARTLWAEATEPVGVRAPGASATHYGPVYLYFAVLARAAAPAIVLLPLAALRAWRSRGFANEPRLRFVALGFASLFVAFSLLPQKRTHYLMPLLPLLALLLAESLVELRERAPERLRRILVGAAVVAIPVAAAGAAGLAIFHIELSGAPRGATATAAALVTLPLAALVWAGLRFHPRVFAAILTSGTLAALLAFYASIDVCRRQVEVGAAAKCPDYDETRWQRAFDHWPALGHFMVAPPKERDS